MCTVDNRECGTAAVRTSKQRKFQRRRATRLPCAWMRARMTASVRSVLRGPSILGKRPTPVACSGCIAHKLESGQLAFADDARVQSLFGKTVYDGQVVPTHNTGEVQVRWADGDTSKWPPARLLTNMQVVRNSTMMCDDDVIIVTFRFLWTDRRPCSITRSRAWHLPMSSPRDSSNLHFPRL